MAAVVCLAGLAGCGGSSPAPDTAKLVSRAVSLKIDTVGVTINSTVSKAAGGASATVTGTASLRLHPRLEGALTFTTAGRTINERIVGQTIYVEVPAIAARDGGRPWIAVSLDTASAASGLNLSALLRQAANADPTDTLKLLRAQGLFRQTGATTIDGQDVTVFTGSFTPDTLPASPVLGPQLVAQLKAKLAQVGATHEDVTIYLASSGLPVRVTTKLTTAKFGTITSTVDLHGINAPVSVSPPPPGQTISLAQAKKLP